MLRSLYDYAVSHDLALPPGFVPKTVKAYIDLSSSAKEYVGLVLGDNEAIPCPDIGSLANGTDKSNVMVEKQSVVLPEGPSAKSDFFLHALRAAAEETPCLEVCVSALEDAQICKRINELLHENKIKPSDRISFQVDGIRITELDSVKAWWQEYRKQFQKQDGKNASLYLESVHDRIWHKRTGTPGDPGFRSLC